MTSAIAAVLLAISRSLELSILLKATIVLAVTLVVLRLVRHASASVRHVILAAMFGVLMLLPIAAIVSPPIALSMPTSSATRSTAHPITIAPEPGVQSIVLANGYARPTAASGRSISWRAAVRGGWVVGAVLFLVPVALSLARSRRLRRNGVAWTGGEPLVRMLAAEAGCRRRVSVLLHDAVVVPMTCAFVRPTIMLPPDAGAWSPDDIRRALVHEFEHVRRADWPIRLTVRFVCAIYWFHPLIWVAWRQLCLTSEHACDDAVLRSAERTAYADQLVTLARRLVNHGANAGLSIASRGDLAARITAVLNTNQSRGHVGPCGVAAATLAAFALLLAIAPLRAVARSTDGALNVLISSRLQVDLTGTAFQVGTRSASGSLSASINNVNVLPPPPAASTREASPQTADAAASSFAVASVQRGAGFLGTVTGPAVSGPDFTWRNAQLRWLIQWAYNVDRYQIVGEPGWAGGSPSDGAEYFDITVRANAPASKDDMRLMLRKVLADRFNLVVHTESRDEPFYALVLVDQNGTLGPNMHPATADCKTLREAAEREGRTPGPNYFPCGNHVGIGQGSARGMNIATLAGILSRDAGRKVVDKTGLDGLYDWELTWTPEPLRHHAPNRFPSVDPEGPSIFTAVQEQLGLSLEPAERLSVVLVIDRVERPTPD